MEALLTVLLTNFGPLGLAGYIVYVLLTRTVPRIQDASESDRQRFLEALETVTAKGEVNSRLLVSAIDALRAELHDRPCLRKEKEAV